MKRMISSILFVTPILLSAATSSFAQASCPSFAALADAALLPAVGSPALVQQMVTGADAWTAAPLSQNFDPRAAASALADRLRASRSCPRGRDRQAAPSDFVCEYQSRQDDKASLDVDMRAGSITYLNPARRFDPAGPDNAVTNDQALAVTTAVAQGLGIPMNQLNLGLAHTRAVRMHSKGVAQGSMATDRRIEVVTMVGRIVNGWPVFDSSLKVAIGADGSPARVHTKWPDFSWGVGETGNVVTRQQIIDAIVEELGERAQCDGIANLSARVEAVEKRSRPRRIRG